MEFISLSLFAATLYGIAQKIAEKSIVDPALEKGLAPFKEWLTKGYDQKKAEADLLNAFRESIKEINISNSDNELTNWLIEVGLDRLQLDNQNELRRQVAVSLINLISSNPKLPDSLTQSLNWPLSKTDELLKLLTVLRGKLFTYPSWQPLLLYANELYQQNILETILNKVISLDGAFVNTSDGLAIRAVIVPEKRFEAEEISERAKLIDWLINRNASFSIPNLNVNLPISEAWARLNAMTLSEEDNSTELSKLKKDITNYREWYRLIEKKNNHYDAIDVEKIVIRHRLLVIIGGPGSGKSTLLRRIAWLLLQEKKITFRVSLRTISLRLKNGESFEEALLATALDGFHNFYLKPQDLLNNLDCLLADGLDETNENRAILAEHLQNWAQSHPNSQVIVTTRPIGYNASWLATWLHYEILPIDEYGIKSFASEIFGVVYQDKEDPISKKDDFLNAIKNSKVASIASRNPQLLGFLISLFINGKKLNGTRSQLFERIVQDILQQTRIDKTFNFNVDKTIAYSVIECLGWLLLQNPMIGENDLENIIGKYLQEQFGITFLQSKQKVIDTLMFWEERGLIEKFIFNEFTTFAFIHAAFHEYMGAKYLSGLANDELMNWIVANYKKPEFREIIVFLGGTERLELIVTTLLNGTDIDDFVSTTPILAASILAESEKTSPLLNNLIVKYLIPRLNSNIPTVVDETVSALLPLAELLPNLIGPIALELTKNSNPWTLEAACVLGLVAGDNYVDKDTLISIYLNNNEYSNIPSSRFGFLTRDYINILLIQGGEYLIKNDTLKFKEIILSKYDDSKLSYGTVMELEILLQKVFLPEEISQITKLNWNFNFPSIEDIERRHREEWQLILNTVLIATQNIEKQVGVETNTYITPLASLCSVLDVAETPASDLPLLIDMGITDDLVEVFRGAILVAEINPAQLRTDCEKLLVLMENQNSRTIEVLNWSVLKINVAPNWAKVQNKLDQKLLLNALLHPVFFVGRFAALLLLEYKDNPSLKSELIEILNKASGYTLNIIAYISKDIWGEDTELIILDYLENKFNDESAPLIEVLGSIGQSTLTDRTNAILGKALDSKEVEIVIAALKVIEDLGLFNDFYLQIKDTYDWWIHMGPQDPKEGVVPKNAAEALFKCLFSNNYLPVTSIIEATKSKRSDVRKLAISAVCNLCVKNESFFMEILPKIKEGKLSVEIITELKKSHPEFCVNHLNDLLKMLETENLKITLAVLRVFDNKSMYSVEVENKLRSLLNSSQPKVRDFALHSLRKLIE